MAANHAKRSSHHRIEFADLHREKSFSKSTSSINIKETLASSSASNGVSTTHGGKSKTHRNHHHSGLQFKTPNKPALEIYRPPSLRSDLCNNNGTTNSSNRLNVYAKEFNSVLQPSRSSGNLFALESNQLTPLQHSKSSGSILKHQQSQSNNMFPMIPARIQLPNSHSTSSVQIIPMVFQQSSATQHHHNHHQQTNNNRTIGHTLKRSKSMGNNENLQIQQSNKIKLDKLSAQLKDLPMEQIDLSVFPDAMQPHLKVALATPDKLPSRVMMDLVQGIMERVVDGIKYCESGAKLCMAIIETEQRANFLESLLNICQQWYQERERLLRTGDGTRFAAFMWFLTEMCGRLKRHPLFPSDTNGRSINDSVPPDLVLLSVLVKCCQACVQPPIKCPAETECLFFVLTSIGRDLEAELPHQLDQLLVHVRDGFLASAASAAVRRTLLQLIELHASDWQLAGSSVLYYYPRIK